MVLPADDVGDPHLDVVANDRQIVKRMTVRAEQNEVFDFGVIAFLKSVNRVFKTRLSRLGNFQTNRKRLARFGFRVRFFFRQIAIRIVAHVLFAVLLPRAFDDRLLDVFVGGLFLRREIAVRFAFFQQAKRGGAMLFGVVGLKERFSRPAPSRATSSLRESSALIRRSSARDRCLRSAEGIFRRFSGRKDN